MMEESEHDGRISELPSEIRSESRAIRKSSSTGKLSDYSNMGGIIKKGILSKRGRKKIFRPWVLRTIVLDDRNMLSYYDGRTLKGSFSLEGTSTAFVPPERADGRLFAFEITNIQHTGALQSNSLLLAAGSQPEAEEWIEAIISLMRKHVSMKVNIQYESFDTISRNTNLSQPINIKKLKQSRKKSAEEDEDDNIPSEEEEG
eukprot:gene4815-5169_t